MRLYHRQRTSRNTVINVRYDMTPKQKKRSLETITEVQMMLGDLPKGKRLKAYNKLEKVKLLIKKQK